MYADIDGVIPLEEVREHASPEKRVWVTFRGNVFDITPFLNGHPGLKSRLLMVGGQDLANYWSVYNDHYRGHVIPFLQKMKIGRLSAADRQIAENPEFEFINAYDDDPVRHEDLLFNTYHPFNGECLLERLTEQYYTPNHLHYVRNHLPVPRIEAEDWELTISKGNGIKETKVYSYDDIRTKFKKYEVVSPLQCAGNRREDFHGLSKLDGSGKYNEIFIGPHWVVGAFSCAKWGGCRLRDLLADCGLDVDNLALGNIDFGPSADTAIGAHFHFTGTDCDETGLEYGVSIPMDKAVDGRGDVLIAYEMNGVPLPRDHGFPARALVPGFAGARNCKWIQEVSLEMAPSMKPWHENAYRGFSPDITFADDLFIWEDAEKVNLRHVEGLSKQKNLGPIALEQPIQSVVCNPPPNAVLGGEGMEYIEVKGVAWSGGGRNVHRVDVSIDGGKSFVGTELYKPADLRARERRMCQWGWYHFSAKVPVPADVVQKLKDGKKHKFEILSKAVSGDFNVQPSEAEHVYNARGIQINHYYRVPVTADGNLPKGAIIRNVEQDKKDRFRNKPSGGQFRIPWKPLNGDMDKERVNKNDREQSWDKGHYDWGHCQELQKSYPLQSHDAR